MELLSLIITFASGAITVPIVNWLKDNVLRDFPLENMVFVVVINCLIAWGVGAILGTPDWTLATAIQYILSAQFGSQVIHSVTKTIKDKRGGL